MSIDIQRGLLVSFVHENGKPKKMGRKEKLLYRQYERRPIRNVFADRRPKDT